MNPLRNTSDYGTSNILDKLAEHAGIELERIGEEKSEEGVDSFSTQQNRIGACSVRDRLIKIARLVVGEGYEYRYDPDHKKKPDGNEWKETEKGWGKGKNNPKEEIVDKNGNGQENSQSIRDGIKTRLTEQIKSPQFKKWFGKSKVVDTEGSPLIVYHGTGEKFTSFDLRKTGWNYGSGENAFFFVSDKNTADNYARGKTPTTMAVYLSLQKPIIIKAGDKYNAIDYYDDNISANVFGYQADGYDGVLIKYDKGVFAVAFYPTQIKSALGNNGDFDPNNPKITASSQRSL